MSGGHREEPDTASGLRDLQDQRWASFSLGEEEAGRAGCRVSDLHVLTSAAAPDEQTSPTAGMTVTETHRAELSIPSGGRTPGCIGWCGLEREGTCFSRCVCAAGSLTAGVSSSGLAAGEKTAFTGHGNCPSVNRGTSLWPARTLCVPFRFRLPRNSPSGH